MEDLSDNTLKPIVFKTSAGFTYLDYNDIIMCSADGNCTDVFTIEKKNSVKILHKIVFIERRYCNKTFLRCHKSYIINLVYLEKLLVKTHQAQLKGDFIAPLSDDCWRKIKHLSEKNIQ